MSASNKIGIYALEETTAYGVVESSGNFSTVRKSTETLDGTPQTKKSPEIRDDRQPSGQNVVGLTLGGDIGNPMVRDAINDEFIGGALYNTPVAADAMTADTITIDAAAKTLTFTSQNPSTTFTDKDFVSLTGFTNVLNNTTVICSGTPTSTVLTYIGGDLMVNETGSGDEVATMPAHLDIGAVKRSWSIERKYGDLTSKVVDYTGMRVAKLMMKLAYGDFADMKFSFAGNGYNPMPAAGLEITNGRTIDVASTNLVLNASSDIGMVIVDGVTAECGFSELGVDIDNNMKASTTIGKIAPCNQTGFEASVNVTAVMELTDNNTDLVKYKIDQTPIELATFSVDSNGLGYGIHVYAAQLSFNDPNASAGNKFVSMNMSGQGTVESTTNRAVRVYLMGTLA